MQYILLAIKAIALIVLLCAAISDAQTRTVSNKYTYIMLALCALKISLLAFDGKFIEIMLMVLGGMIVFTVFFFLSIIQKKKGMGGADIKLTSALSLLIGLENIFPVLLSSLIFSLIYSLYEKKHKRTATSIPFITFLFAGTSLCFSIL